MKIIKQLSENEFVLKMEEHDLREMTSVKIAHDYVQIAANMGIQVKSDCKPYGKFASCASNWIKGYSDVQINIRKFIKVVLPLFNKHKYCQEEHLLQEDENLLITGKLHRLLVEMKTTNGMFILNKKMGNSIKYH